MYTRDYALSLISPYRQKKLLAYRQTEDLNRSLLGEICVRTEVSKMLNISPSVLHILFNDYGKPYFQEYSDVHFNISHSGKMIVCAFSTSPVGVDVEFAKPYSTKSMKHFFTSSDYSQIVNMSPEERQETFFTAWTQKESYMKAIGKGFSIPFNSIRISPAGDNLWLISSPNEPKLFASRFFLNDNDYYCYVCGHFKSILRSAEVRNSDQVFEEFINRSALFNR